MLIIGQRKTLLRVEFADSKVVVHCLGRVGSTPTATILRIAITKIADKQAF
nr:MAG TPA: hypothetical protein [Bacteriophage sp.]